jgi:hypothetical protein
LKKENDGPELDAVAFEIADDLWFRRAPWD